MSPGYYRPPRKKTLYDPSTSGKGPLGLVPRRDKSEDLDRPDYVSVCFSLLHPEGEKGWEIKLGKATIYAPKIRYTVKIYANGVAKNPYESGEVKPLVGPPFYGLGINLGVTPGRGDTIAIPVRRYFDALGYLCWIDRHTLTPTFNPMGDLRAMEERTFGGVDPASEGYYFALANGSVADVLGREEKKMNLWKIFLPYIRELAKHPEVQALERPFKAVAHEELHGDPGEYYESVSETDEFIEGLRRIRHPNLRLDPNMNANPREFYGVATDEAGDLNIDLEIREDTLILHVFIHSQHTTPIGLKKDFAYEDFPRYDELVREAIKPKRAWSRNFNSPPVAFERLDAVESDFLGPKGRSIREIWDSICNVINPVAHHELHGDTGEYYESGGLEKELGFLGRFPALREAGLSRIVRWLQGPASFGMISGSRAEVRRADPQKNIDNTYRLGEELRRAGYGYIRFEGGYPETDPESGETTPVSEYSLFVPGVSGNEIETDNRLKGVLVEAGRRYNQESILYRAYREREIKLVPCAGGEETSVGTDLSFNALGDYWSRLRRGTTSARRKFELTGLH